MAEVLLSRRAVDDLRRLTAADRERIERALAALALDAPNLDVRPLLGRAPWRRLRRGDVRVIFRVVGDEPGGRRGDLLVARVVNRRDLDDVVRGLPIA